VKMHYIILNNAYGIFSEKINGVYIPIADIDHKITYYKDDYSGIMIQHCGFSLCWKIIDVFQSFTIARLKNRIPNNIPLDKPKNIYWEVATEHKTQYFEIQPQIQIL